MYSPPSEPYRVPRLSDDHDARDDAMKRDAWLCEIARTLNTLDDHEAALYLDGLDLDDEDYHTICRIQMGPWEGVFPA